VWVCMSQCCDMCYVVAEFANWEQVRAAMRSGAMLSNKTKLGLFPSPISHGGERLSG
jgi:hypothetical protein